MTARPDLALRLARPDEWQAVADLHAASWRSAYRGILSDEYLDGRMAEDRRAVWKSRFADPLDPSQVVSLAILQGEPAPAGFACILYGHDPDWGSLIDNLHVRPDLRRHRIGRIVLAHAARSAPEGFEAMPLHLTVFEQNARAIAAYESWGGRLAERLDHVEGDGRTYKLRRYAWDNPAELIAALG